MSSTSTSPSSPSSSSNNCKRYSPDESDTAAAMVDSIENHEKKVCFICGSQTTLFINIYEPRAGPNMIDVISEKFKMRPLTDDKFLCYNCNNWLVNWYSMRKTTNDSSNGDDQHSTTSATMSAAIMANEHEQTSTKTSDEDTQCIYDPNELVIISDDDEDDENIDVNNIVQTLRNRLKKYLYYPNRQKSNDLDEWQAIHSHTTLVELNKSATNGERDCKQCSKLFRRRLNQNKKRIFCRSCRFLMRRYGNSTIISCKFDKNHSNACQYQRSTRMLPLISKRPTNALTLNHHTNIFEKLQQLGTSIYYENEYRADQQQQQHKQQQQQNTQKKSYHLHRHMTSIPHEIDMKAQKNGIKTWKRHTNGSNEILMTFNSVVTEVFPIDELYSKYYSRSNDQISNVSTAQDSTQTKFNIQEILRNVPKSLTITIAQ